MKATIFTSRRKWWTLALMGLNLLCLFVASACGPTPTVETIAKDIAANVGRVMTVVAGTPNQIVIVFEETHISPAGQIEIAIMLNRLYEKHNSRSIGLEGAFAKDGNLDAKWFDPSFKAGQPIRAREDAIVQLLEDGEISNAEMMTLTYADVRVTGIEIKDQYDVEIPEKAESATTIYLYKIALPGIKQQSDINKINDLVKQNKILEAVEYAISTDKYAKETYARLSDPKTVLSVEELVKLIDEIEARATQAKANITSEDKANLAALRKFFQTASDRTKTMVDNTLPLVRQFPGPPVAMITGAAHTDRTIKLLKESGVSFAVIRGNSLADGRKNGDLSSKAYKRKSKQLSVYPPGGLGALLDGRKKPRSVIGELSFKSEAELRLLTTLIARAAARGELPPFDEALKEVLPNKLKSVTLVPNTLRVIGKDVIFSVNAVEKNSNIVQVWVRAKVDKIAAAKPLEERLLEGLSNVQKKDSPDPSKSESDGSVPILERVSSDVIAKFSRSQSAIESTTLGG